MFSKMQSVFEINCVPHNALMHACFLVSRRSKKWNAKRKIKWGRTVIIQMDKHRRSCGVTIDSLNSESQHICSTLDAQPEEEIILFPFAFRVYLSLSSGRPTFHQQKIKQNSNRKTANNDPEAVLNIKRIIRSSQPPNPNSRIYRMQMNSRFVVIAMPWKWFIT